MTPRDRLRNLLPAVLPWALLAACAQPPARGGDVAGPEVDPAELRHTVGVLAADSLRGRMTGTPGAELAARFLAERLRGSGVRPPYPEGAGPDSAFFQRVPMATGVRRGGREAPVLVSSWEALASVAPERRVAGANVVGVIPGSDPVLRDQAVVVAAHYDHVGVGRPVDGDSIYNGADDDASGVAAVLEIARALAAGPAPRRTVVILLSTGEEVGLLGTRWYMAHPTVPLGSTVAQLEVEMIGRPDAAVGGAGRAWLTGHQRSTMGERLAAAGVPLVADPRPDQNFFQRSDNIAFACRGIPAHTLSSFGLHEDYHTPDDEVERIHFEHMARVTGSAIAAVRMLTDGPAPRWNPGGSPQGDAAVCGRFARLAAAGHQRPVRTDPAVLAAESWQLIASKPMTDDL